MMKLVIDTDRDFSLFIDAHTQSLLGTAVLLSHSRHAADELVQDTLVSLYPNWDKVMRADAPLAYVRRSLVNRFLNQRRRAVERTRPLDEAFDNVTYVDFTDTVADQDAISRALARLPARQRVAIVLRYFDDVADEEAARILGCRPGTFRSLLSRGIATMRADLSSTRSSPHESSSA